MMKIKRAFSWFVTIAILLTVIPTTSFATVTSTTQKGWEKYPVVHKGINWQLTNATLENVTTDNCDTPSIQDDITTTEVLERESVSYINDAGNLYSTTEGKSLLKTSCPYGMYLYSSDNPDNMFKKANFNSDHEFEVKFKHSDQLYVMLYTGNYRHYIQINGDSEICYAVADGASRSIEADVPFNQWHILKLAVRKGNIATIYMDGKEIVTYEMMVSRTTNPYVMMATYYHIDSVCTGIHNSAEIEYATLTPIAGGTVTPSSNILLSGVTEGQKFHVGDSVLLKSSTSVGGDSISDTGSSNSNAAVYSDYYVNGEKVGTDDVTSQSLHKWINTSSSYVNYTKYVNRGFKYTFTEEGDFEIYSVDSKSRTSNSVTVSVVADKSASLTVPDTIGYGEVLSASVATTDISNVTRYNFYVNGELKQSSASNSTSIAGLPVGKVSVFAKVICSDGCEYTTKTKFVQINAGEIPPLTDEVSFSREYQLDYTYDGTMGAGNNLAVYDGYFALNFTHNGNTISYTDSSNQAQTYTGVGNGIGAGSYRIVATAGNAEVYYNDHFLFSCLMPTSTAEQSITYGGGISGVSLKSSGVKAERFYGVWNTAESIEAYDFDVDKFYSLEFNKDNTESETIVIYDGEFQSKLIFDERGITTYAQFENYETPKEFNLTDNIQTGYYRLTVAHGLAQLFVNNHYINSFACTVNPHAKAVMRSAVDTAVTRMISVKDTDDVYYHKENFENDTEYDYTNYWFSEYEGFALEDGEADLFTQEINTEGTNHYLTIKDNGLQPESYEGYMDNALISQPVADWSLNANPDNPVFKWRAKADGTGEVHFMARHFQKGFFNSVSYNFTDEKWYVNRYSVKDSNVSLNIDDGEKNCDGSTALTKYTAIRRIERTVLAESPANSLDTGWHDYEMLINDDYIALICDGTRVIEYTGLVNGHGKVGFGVSYGAALSIDNVEYAGNSVVASGLTYLSTGDMASTSVTVVTQYKEDGVTPKKTASYGTSLNHGSKDFYKTPTLGTVAGNANYYSYNTQDGGKTWSKVVDDNGHYNVIYPNSNTLNLKSGLFMRIGTANWGKPIYDENGQLIEKDTSYIGKRLYSTVYPNGDYNTVPQLNGDWANENMVVDPYDFPSNIYNQSTIASQLVQVQDGDYAGRIFMVKTIGGERYGGDVVFYTDMDRNFIANGAPLNEYYNSATNRRIKILNDDWYKSQTDLIYPYLGTDAQEGKVVDLPNSLLRYYHRGDSGFLQYSESYDGGVTWSKAYPSQFISPRCSYGIVRDPNNLNNYYAFWEYDANTSDRMNDGGRPRTRLALAVSLDGMNTWQYLGDMEELTDDWRKSNDGVSTLSTPQNHGLRVADGTVYMSYGANGVGFSKIFAMDTSKLKPLARFSEVHDKVIRYVNGSQELSKKAAIIPKKTGKGKIYETNTNVTLTDGNYSEDIIAKVMEATSNGNGVFTVDSRNYTITPDANGNFDIIEAASVFGKKVVETENAYIISNTEISRADAYYLDGISILKNSEEDERDEFLNQFNLAVEYNDTETMRKLLNDNAKFLGAPIETSNTAALEKMLGYRYYKIDDINKIYDMAVKAAAKANDTEQSALALTTVSDGFDDWDVFADGRGTTVRVADNTVTVSSLGVYTNSGEFGTAAFDVPDTDKYILNFDVQIDENSEARIKWGNSSHLMQIVLNSGNITDFSVKNDEIPLTIQPNVWYNLCVMVTRTEFGRNVIVKIAQISNDGTIGEYNQNTFNGVTGTCGRKGFWIEADNLSARNIRLYSDKAIEVVDFTAVNGKASATVNFLNFDAETTGLQSVMNIFNDDVFAGTGTSEEITEAIAPMGVKKLVFTDVAYKALQGVEPVAKFCLWKDTLNLQTVAKPTQNIRMTSKFEDDFSGAYLDSAKYRISGGNVENTFLGIEDGVLKMRKTVNNVFDLQAKLEPQTDNMIVSYDIKIDTMPTMLQIQWYGGVYTSADNLSQAERIVYYIQPNDSGAPQMKTGSYGGGNYDLATGVWYTVLMTVTGSGANKCVKFYLKERDSEQDFINLFPENTITTATYNGTSLANTFRLYEGHGPDMDVSIDNLRVTNGIFKN